MSPLTAENSNEILRTAGTDTRVNKWELKQEMQKNCTNVVNNHIKVLSLTGG